MGSNTAASPKTPGCKFCHVNMKPGLHCRAFDGQLFATTTAAAPWTSSASGIAKSAIREANKTIRSLTSLREKNPGELGRHASANDTKLVLNRHPMSVVEKLSLWKLPSVDLCRRVLNLHANSEEVRLKFSRAGLAQSMLSVDFDAVAAQQQGGVVANQRDGLARS